MNIDFGFLLAIVTLIFTIYLVIDGYVLTKIIRSLFMLREGEKLACMIYASLMLEVMSIKGVQQKVDKADSETIKKYTEQITKIITTNSSIEAGLYREIKRRHIMDAEEKQMREVIK